MGKKTTKNPQGGQAFAIIVLGGAIVELAGACVEFYNIAWGTGSWRGEFSAKWAAAFVTFVLCCAAALAWLGFALFRRRKAREATATSGHDGPRLRFLRWLVALLAVAMPIWILQYCPWGVAVAGPFLRLLIWSLASLLVGYAVAGERGRTLKWTDWLVGVLVTGTAFVVAAAFTDVTSYPFSLGWSEGNRLWDYSLLFGKHLYQYASDDQPVAYLDIGRQLIGGLPFVLPRVSIIGERAWLALVAVIPYLGVGVATFWKLPGGGARTWLLPATWTLAFLSQGPIHPPLLLCAILVAIAWRQPFWLAAGLVGVAGYFAEVSRFTWMFAPAMWAVMLEIGGTPDGKLDLHAAAWRRAAVSAVAGLAGSALGYLSAAALSSSGAAASPGASAQQALLWYRLLPNATYGNGILVGLAFAAAPLALILYYFGRRYWKPRPIQGLCVALPLLAFLAVGLVVSTKIGGGGDLHNLDMFLIGLVFAAAVVWKSVDERWLQDLRGVSTWLRVSLVLLVALPAYWPLLSLHPLSFSGDAEWLRVLTDAGRTRDLGSLPPSDIIDESLGKLRDAVAAAQSSGPVLFMDQRQLLTFGFLTNTNLMSEYEKKRMMDEALSGDRGYFAAFYRDLAAHRFPLIISSPLRTPIKDSEYGFGEENNAWVNWVAKPILCYYEEADTLNEVKVELLVPRRELADCSASLP